jgi:CBS domain-containing protein
MCNRKVTFVRASDTLGEAAHVMISNNVGSAVVVEKKDQILKPIGMVTDRDIVRTQLKRASDLYCLSVAEAMTPKPLCFEAHELVVDVLSRMRARGVRRAPVIDRDGALVGIVTLDDLLGLLAEELMMLAGVIARQAPVAKAA